LPKSPVRILLVDDFEPLRRVLSSTLRRKLEAPVIYQESNGLEAVQRAQEVQPDLILLDIGLPGLNGIEAAKRIRQLAPNSKILFLSENRSGDIAEAALRTGALGYVVKSDAANELLPAITAVLQGRRFVSARLRIEFAAHDSSGKKVPTPLPTQNVGVSNHEVGFYSDDRRLINTVAQFIEAALQAGNPAIVLATQSHRDSLQQRFQADGVDIDGATEEGRYVALDAADTLSAFIVNGRPDPVRFMEAFDHVLAPALKTAKGEHPRAVVFGECVNLLWAQGNAEAAIQMEKLGNQLAALYDLDILCGYSLDQAQVDSRVFHRICAEHSAVYVG